MTVRRTTRQRNGTGAENSAADVLVAMGWTVLGRNVRVGRDEIDIVAIDPGPPRSVVCVEVRSASSAEFGTPEERVDRRKVGHLYRGLSALRAEQGRSGMFVGLTWRVDLLIVDRRGARIEIRHLRALEPP